MEREGGGGDRRREDGRTNKEEKGISNQTEKSLFRREEKGKDESGERRRRSGKKVHIRKRLIAKGEERRRKTDAAERLFHISSILRIQRWVSLSS